MHEGIYAMYYTGQQGSGLGLLAFVRGRVVGADAAGGKLEGAYTEDDSGKFITGSIRMNVAPNTWLVTGQPARQEAYTIDLPISLPSDLGGGEVQRLDLPIGSLNIRFEKLADFPESM